MKNINIVVVGKSGSGKSTLINAVLGKETAEAGVGAPVTRTTQSFGGEEIPLTLYDTVGIELDEDKSRQSRNDVEELVRNSSLEGDTDSHIHIMWYCVNSMGKRFEPPEADLISRFEKEHDVPVFIVLTQCVSQKSADELSQTIKDMVSDANVLKVLSEDFETDTAVVSSFGIDELLKSSIENLQGHMARAAKRGLENKAAEARKYVKGFSAGAFVTGFTPIPFSDAPLLVAEQIGMITAISVIFDLPFSKSVIAQIASSIGAPVAASFVGRTIVSNALKFIPGIGTLAGGAISAVTATAITAAVGELYIRVLMSICRDLSSEELLDSDTVLERVRDFIDNNSKKKRGKKTW
ncbi:GTPase [Synergistales bacterium]|nr:GTPase [Synergistales bacterium]